MRRNWQPRAGHAFGGCTLKSCKRRTGPWETPNGEDMSVLPQLEVDGPSDFNAVVGSLKAKTGSGVDAIHPAMWSRVSEKGKQLYTDLLNDVERTLTWPAQIQTLMYFLVPKTPIGERPIGLMPSIVRVWERMRKPILDQWMVSPTRSYDWACKGRSAEMAAWQHLVLEEGQDDKPGMGRATALLDVTKCFDQVRLWHAIGASRERCSGSFSWSSAFNAVWDCGVRCRSQ